MVSMRICLIGDSQSVLIQKWLAYFQSKGHEVHIISDKAPVLKGVHHHSLPASSSSAFNFLMKAMITRRIVKGISPDIVHAHYILGYGFFAVFSKHHPLIVDAMGDDIGSEPEVSRTMRWMARYVLRRADLICVRDPVAMERAILLGGPKAKMMIRYAVCRLDIFKPEARSEQLRTKLGISNHKSVIYLRPLSQHYRSHVLFESIPQLIKEVPEVKVIIVNHGESKEELISMMEKAKVMDNIILIEKIPHDHIQNYLASVDLCVDTFYATSDAPGGGIGTGIMEAMACGTPVLVPDRREFLNPLFKGATYRRGDSNDLAIQMISILTNDSRREQMSKNEREMTMEVGDELKVFQQFETFYLEMIENRNWLPPPIRTA